MAEKSHEVIKLTEAVIAEIHKENRLLSNHTRETNDLHRELESERSIKQRLERENRELQTSSESGQKVLDELRGLKAVVERQADDLGLKISDVKNTDVKNSENQEETACQLLESNAELKRQLDETETALQKCLESLEVVVRRTEKLENVDPVDLDNRCLHTVLKDAAKKLTTDDGSFCSMIDRLDFYRLDAAITEKLTSKLKDLFTPSELQEMQGRDGGSRRLELSTLIRHTYPYNDKNKYLPEETQPMVRAIQLMRNQVSHPKAHDENEAPKTAMILFTASALWPYLPEDPPSQELKMAA